MVSTGYSNLEKQSLISLQSFLQMFLVFTLIFKVLIDKIVFIVAYHLTKFVIVKQGDMVWEMSENIKKIRGECLEKLVNGEMLG